MSEKLFMTTCQITLIGIQIIDIYNNGFEPNNLTIIILSLTILLYVFRATRYEKP